MRASVDGTEARNMATSFTRLRPNNRPFDLAYSRSRFSSESSETMAKRVIMSDVANGM